MSKPKLEMLILAKPFKCVSLVVLELRVGKGNSGGSTLTSEMPGNIVSWRVMEGMFSLVEAAVGICPDTAIRNNIHVLGSLAA